MKKISAFLLGFAVCMAIADEDKPAAPQSVIDEAKAVCEKYAQEDNVPADDLKNFLMECVNEELDAQGYKKVDSLD